MTAARTAMYAVYAAFVSSGFAIASWAARIPQVRDQLRIDPGTLGLVLLCIALGSVVALPVAGVVVTWLGAARTVTLMSLVVATGLVVVAVGERHGIPPVAVGLFLFGFGNGTWDVAMNVQAAAVEQVLGRSIMPRFHAGWSIGTVLGAGAGAALVSLHVSVTVHLIAVAVFTVAVVPVSTRGFLARVAPAGRPVEPGPPRGPLTAWLEPRTLLIGLFVLCMAFSEGTGNDWLSIALIDGYRVTPALGTVTFALFLAAMTTGRWFGPALIDRYGRVPALRGSALLALAGLLIVVFGRALPLAMLGAVLLGLGTALGFPVGLSAAADDPRRAAGRVSVAASIGYVAFLAGPPLIGFLGDHVGVLRGLTVTAGLLACALLLASVTRPLATAATAGPERGEGADVATSAPSPVAGDGS